MFTQSFRTVQNEFVNLISFELVHVEVSAKLLMWADFNLNLPDGFRLPFLIERECFGGTDEKLLSESRIFKALSAMF